MDGGVGSVASDVVVWTQKAEQTRKTSNSDDAAATPGNGSRNGNAVRNLATVLPDTILRYGRLRVLVGMFGSIVFPLVCGC